MHASRTVAVTRFCGNLPKLFCKHIDIGYLPSKEHSSQYLGLPTKMKF